MKKPLKIYVAGHLGMVGSAIIRRLHSLFSVTDQARITDLLPPSTNAHTLSEEQQLSLNIVTRSHTELDLTNQAAVHAFFAKEEPDQVYLSAAKVGGIYANNTFPAEFIYQNLMIQSNIIESAFQHGVKKLLFLGSSCIYPKMADQPMREEALLTNTLEPTNEPYAIAKIAGIKLCESYNRQYGESHSVDYRSVMPTNLYGPRDNYHPENSHVIPALIRRFHEAKINKAPYVTIWGTGTPRREFLYVDDMASACVHLMNLPKPTYYQHTSQMLSHINVGSGRDVSIADVARTIAHVVGYEGGVNCDTSKPDGPPRKLLDSTRINNLGWQPTVDLDQGLALAYQDYLLSHCGQKVEI